MRGRASVVRLPIDRAFTVRGFGVVVTGTLVSGEIAAGDSLELLPAGRPVRVRGLHVHGEQADKAIAPRRVAVNLSGVELSDVARGGTLATRDTLPVTRRADLRVHLLAEARALKHGARVRVHHGTSDAAATVSIAARRAATAGPWVPARLGDLGVTVEPGGDALVRLRLDRPLVLTRGDRVVIRALSPSATIGGGVVLDPMAAGRGVRRAAAAERFQQLDGDEGPRVWLTEAGARGLDVHALARRAGLSPDAAATLVATLCDRQLRAVSGGTRVRRRGRGPTRRAGDRDAEGAPCGAANRSGPPARGRADGDVPDARDRAVRRRDPRSHRPPGDRGDRPAGNRDAPRAARSRRIPHPRRRFSTRCAPPG